MSWCIFLLTLMSVVCMVTSQQVEIDIEMKGAHTSSSQSSSSSVEVKGGAGGEEAEEDLAGSSLHKLTVSDITRMIAGMEAGNKYNFQGQIADPGQPTYTLAQLRLQLAQTMDTVVTDGSSGVQSAPVVDAGASVARFTLDEVRAMIAGMENGILYNYQGKEATPGQATLTLSQLQRFLNELLAQGTQTTADFTQADLDRMVLGMQKGLAYNYQGQIARPGEPTLTLDQINEMLAQLSVKGMDSSAGTITGLTDPSTGGTMKTASFTMDDIIRMKNGMERGLKFNFQGVEAAPGEISLTLEQLNQLEANLKSMGGSLGTMTSQSMGGAMQTASFTMADLIRMKTGMQQGLRYNLQGREALPGEMSLTLEQLNQLEADLKSMGGSIGTMTGHTGGSMGGTMQTASFTMVDILRMKNGMQQGLQYNFQGGVALPGETALTLEQLNQLEANLRSIGMGGASGTSSGHTGGSMGGTLQTASFTMDDIIRMKNGMERGLKFNYQGLEAALGEISLTLEQLNQLEANLRSKGMGGSSGTMTGQTGGSTGGTLRTASFTMDDIIRMKNGMERGARFNYQGLEAATGEIILTLEQLNQFEADLRRKGMGGSSGTMTSQTGGSIGRTLQTASFTMDDIIRMKNGMERGLRFNYQGLEAATGEITLTLEQLDQFEADLKNKGMVSSSVTMTEQSGGSIGGTLQTASFTMDDIIRMKNGMERGLRFNYQGLEAATGEITLTLEQLDQFEAYLRSKGMGGSAGTMTGQTGGSMGRTLQTAAFTMNDIIRMKNGMERGARFNYQGLEAATGEITLTLEQLNQFEADLKNKGMGGSMESSLFTMNDINRIRTGMAQGVQYNLRGQAAGAGEPVLTLDRLNELEANLRNQGMSDTSSSNIQSTTFTVEQINRMLSGMARGVRFNNLGQEAAAGEPSLTIDQLNQLLTRLTSRDTSSAVTVDSKSTTEFKSTSEETRSSSTVKDDITIVATNESKLKSESESAQSQTTLALSGTEPAQIKTTLTEVGSTSEHNRSLSTVKNEIVPTNESRPQRGTEPAQIQTTLAPSLTEPAQIKTTLSEQSSSEHNRSSSSVKEAITIVATNESRPQSGTLPAGSRTTSAPSGQTPPALAEILTQPGSIRQEGSSGEETDKQSGSAGLAVGGTVTISESTGQTGSAVGGTATISERKEQTETAAVRTETTNVVTRVPDTPALTIPGLSGQTGTVNIFIGGGPVPLTQPPSVTTVISSTNKTEGTDESVSTADLGTGKFSTNFTTEDIQKMISGMKKGETISNASLPPVVGHPALNERELKTLLEQLEATSGSTGESIVDLNPSIAETVDSKTASVEIGSKSEQNRSSSSVQEAITIIATNENRQESRTEPAQRQTTSAPSGIDSAQTKTTLTEQSTSEHNRSSSLVKEAITIVGANESRQQESGREPAQILTTLAPSRTDSAQSQTTITKQSTSEHNRSSSSVQEAITIVGTNESRQQESGREPAQIQTTLAPSLTEPAQTKTTITEIGSTSEHNRSSSLVKEAITIVGTNESRTQSGTEPAQSQTTSAPSGTDSAQAKTTITEIGSISEHNRSLSEKSNLVTGVPQTPALTLPGLSGQTGTVNIFIGGSPGPLTQPTGVTTVISSTNRTEDKRFLKEAKFSVLDVMNILHGMDEGKSYNYKGEIASPGELKLPRKLLLNYLFQFNSTEVQQAMKLIATVTNFTREHVERMLKDTERGQRYNYDGELTVSDDEETFTTDTLKLILDYLIDAALPNVALFKKAEISSSYETGWTADKAVDGNINQDMNLDSCFHTGHDQDPYFILDLGDVYDIKRLTLYNRQDCCDDRLKNVAISTGLTRDKLEEKNFIPGPFPSVTTVPFTAPTQAQFVKIQVKERNRTFMHLCEVQVFGTYVRTDACKGEPCKNGGTCTNKGSVDNCLCTPGWAGVDCTSSDRCAVNPCLNGGSCTNTPEADLCRCPADWTGAYCQINKRNIAFGKPAWMSSLFQNNDKYRADRGVDGNPNTDMGSGACFHTNNEVQPSWTVDLGAVYDIMEIKLTNRMDCCSERAVDIEILAGLTTSDMRPISFLPGELGPNRAIQIPTRTEGQYVTIRIKNPMAQTLHLCEVEVFGAHIRPDGCKGEPCRNGGTCTNTGGANNCVCASGWSGPNCAVLDLCAREPCLNGGTCTNIPGAELCSCLPEWTGAYCQISKQNIGFGKPAWMSSLYQNNDTYRAEKGVDGNPSTDMGSGACFHTNNEIQPSWTVDLGAVYELQEIKLTNRLDCCSERARDIEILAGLTRADMRPVFFHAGELGPFRTIPIMSGTEGQFVTVRIRNPNAQTLHLCEVEVFGIYVRSDLCAREPCLNGGTCTNIPGAELCSCLPEWTGTYCQISKRNIGFGKPAWMSSLFQNNDTYRAEKGVDGNPSTDMGSGACFHTNNEIQPSWTVDLGAVYELQEIKLTNRLDCCSERARDIEILAGLTRADMRPVFFHAGELGPFRTIPIMSGTEGQFVTVRIRNPNAQTLHLCEVEVFGIYVRSDLCAREPCLNGGTCTNIPGAELCSCLPEWTGTYCQTSKRNIGFGKPAWMSSLYQNNDTYRAEKGVDGNPSTDMGSGACFHTNNEIQPSWTVDLGAVYELQEIKLTNRLDCCSERARDIEILAGLTRADMRPVFFHSGELGPFRTIPIMSRTEGQFVTVRIRNPNAQTLHLCEVEVFGIYVRSDGCKGEPCKNGGTCTNAGGANICVCASGWSGPTCAVLDLCAIEPCLNGGTCTNIPGAELCSCLPEWTGAHCQISTRNIAFGKPAQMSSLYQNNDTYRAEKGVDGNSNTDISSGACFHTNNEVQPSWTVDLGAVYELQEIKLTNRLDCCSERARDIEILAGLTRADMRPIYFHAGELGPFRTIPIMSGTEGQFVTVRIRNPNAQTLHLCEVEVFGIYVRPDRCIGVSCLNGGTCTNKGGVNNCQCPAGFGGLRCQLDESKLTEPHINETSERDQPDWMKSRVDPSACRRSNCNLPICYIPYANDCKSYIVCQRTAIGTYVAWRMRCAFGSYWGRGTTYTCEHVEELAKQGYKCPNDPCADRTVRTYPDEEEKNCRTYWTCENGVSYPACCPHGEQFDRITLKCEKDRHEVCRSPCPLKVAGCSAGVHKQPFYDGNCRTYWDCDKGSPHPVCCPDGMSFDFFKGHCIHDSTCTDLCPLAYTQQVCGKITGASTVQSYPLSDGNCRTYMKCTSEGYDEPHCCRQDFFYDTVSGSCQRVEDMNSRCHTESCPAGYHEECRFSAVENPTQFYDNDADLVRDCAPGTTFAPKICTCDGTSTVDICKPEVWVKFDNLEDTFGIKNHGDGSISKFGDLTKNRTDSGITYGTFDGSSGLEVWRYDHTALPEVTMEITFQSVAANGQEKQILASNCMSVENGQPSFEVSLNPQTSKVTFSGKSRFDSAEVSVPYNKQNWNTYKLFYDGTNIVAMVEDPAGIAKREIQTAKLRGSIIAGVGPLKFGPCYDGFSSPMTNGLTGFMSNVVFSKCIDRRGRELVQEYSPPEIRTHTIAAVN